MSTTIYVLATEDGKIDKCSLDPVSKDFVPYEVDDNVGPDDLWKYEIVDGKLQIDSSRVDAQLQLRKSLDEGLARDQQRNVIIDMLATNLVSTMSFANASEATKVAKFAPEWSGNSVRYDAGSIVVDPSDGQTYICNEGQGHTSQAGWAPHAAPSLWSLIKIAPDGNREWVQPTGAHNDYEEGEKCWYPDYETGSLYTSKQNGNVWPPSDSPTSTWTI